MTWTTGARAVHDDAADEGLVGGEGFGGGGVDIVVGGEIEEDEVGLMAEDIAVEAEDAELRPGSADGGVVELEAGLRIGFLKALGDQGAVGGLVGGRRRWRPR